MGLASWLPDHRRQALKARWLDAKRRFVQRFLSYDAPTLLATLRALGIREGDTVVLHSASGAQYGFRGSVEALVDVFVEAVGPDGTLVMMSMPYRTSTVKYLETLKAFDVRRTPSMMGMPSELFRRRPDVLRSLSPTHPVLARGPLAEWLVAGHEDCLLPCGPGSPFEKLAEVDAKAVFFNVPFDTFTFVHYLEHLVHEAQPIPLYTDTAFDIPVVDHAGRPRRVAARGFNPEIIPRRRFAVLDGAMRARGQVREKRIGNGRVIAVRVRDSVDTIRALAAEGRYMYAHPEGPADRA
jgi:aminoglycoside 3-N-acetyltransferase